jgi:hypothetical protein
MLADLAKDAEGHFTCDISGTHIEVSPTAVSTALRTDLNEDEKRKKICLQLWHGEVALT